VTGSGHQPTSSIVTAVVWSDRGEPYNTQVPNTSNENIKQPEDTGKE
jgi:hypothetical protein